jgi:type VI secretion system secreted protein VgrG
MTGEEELARPFRYDLELLSANENVSLSGLVGQAMAVHMELPGSPLRHFHGIVTRFSQQGWLGRRIVYHATLRPSLWLLTRRAGCRIFQNQSVPQIVRAVLADYGFPYDLSLSGSYPTREYVVQYRETDFAFVSRLMEQEGVYYYFKHEAGKHTLVLADSVGAHQKLPGYEDIPFYPPQEGERRERDHIERWQPFHQLEPTAFALRDYDFTKPRASLEVKRSEGGGGSPELEIYDYPGGYVQMPEGERYARTRLEESAAVQARAEGAGNARGIGPGILFNMTGHPRQDQNREYLVVSAAYDLDLPEQESSAAASGAPVYRCRFTAQESGAPYRPPRITPRPVVQGLQTARVVGKAGEEIWTDSYGRVKVEFHWDRASPGDEGSSCWVRVAQAWSGGAWGAMHIPRMGQEVVVQFLEGDPDRPLVTGHLYEADHMPPYALPANQTRSGFKSRSTKGGGPDNANEIRFEDKKGDEQLYLQAEKNYDLLVKNDATNTVGHDEKHEVKNDETHIVGHDRKKSVGNDETTDVKKNRTETVGGNESIAISGSRTESVDKDESISVGGGRTESVAKDESVSVGGSRSLEVAKNETIDVGDNRTESVGKDATLTVEGNRTESVTKDLTVSVSGGRTTTVSKADTLKVEKALSVNATDGIVLESGSAKLTLKKDGTIVLEGKDITVKGSGKIAIDASGDLITKASKIKQN